MPESHDTSPPEDNNNSSSPDESGGNELPSYEDSVSAGADSVNDSSKTDDSANSTDADPGAEIALASASDSTDELPTESISDGPDLDSSGTSSIDAGIHQEGPPREANSQDVAPPPAVTPPDGPILPTASYPPKRPPAPVRRWRAFRRRYARDKGASVALTVIALVLVIIVSVIAWRVSLPPEPVQVVEEYLSALQDGEIKEALQFTHMREHEFENNPFIEPDVLRTDWHIDNLELTYEGVGVPSSTNDAIVEATLEAPNGTTVTSSIELIEFADEWRVEDPMIQLTVDDRLSPHITVNGHSFEELGGSFGTHTLSMLPGIYSFDVEAEGIFESTGVSVIGIGDDVKLLDDDSGNLTTSGDDSGPHDLTFAVDLHSSAQDTVQQKVEDIVAECYSNLAADRSYGSTGCPFTYEEQELLELAGVDYNFMMRWDELTWTNYEAPEVSVSWHNHESEGFILQSSGDGFFEFSGVTNERAGSVEADFMCTFGAGQLNAFIDDGELAVQSTSVRHEQSDTQCRLVD